MPLFKFLKDTGGIIPGAAGIAKMTDTGGMLAKNQASSGAAPSGLDAARSVMADAKPFLANMQEASENGAPVMGGAKIRDTDDRTLG